MRCYDDEADCTPTPADWREYAEWCALLGPTEILAAVDAASPEAVPPAEWPDGQEPPF